MRARLKSVATGLACPGQSLEILTLWVIFLASRPCAVKAAMPTSFMMGQ